MNEYYTLEQAMKRLGMMSANAFWQLGRKYPEAFLAVNSTNNKNKRPLYDKAALDKFAQTRQKLEQEEP